MVAIASFHKTAIPSAVSVSATSRTTSCSGHRHNDKDVKSDLENTGYGGRGDRKLDPYAAASLPMTCRMKRPEQ
jgi:hypothetical protein